MSEFLTCLDYHEHPDNEEIYILDFPLIYYSDLLQTKIVVPNGFYTDLSSVPRVPIVFMMWGNRCHSEAVIHDYLYRKDSLPCVTYSQANSVFLEAMATRGKSWYVRYPMYQGVVLGGWCSYHKRSVHDVLN